MTFNKNLCTKIASILFLCLITIFICGAYTSNNIKFSFIEDPEPGKINPPSSEDSNKVVYLTFDDGPSKNTPKVLDILKSESVKATFFVVGPIFPDDVQYMKRAYEEGHSIGNHTYDHDYKYVYVNEDAFWKNYEKAQKYIYEVTGSESQIFRFPGGSKSSIVRNAHGKEFNRSLGKKLNEKGIEFFDWNVDSGDGMSDNNSSSTLYNNILKEMKLLQDKSKVIVLMHDSKGKKSTVEALPSIIKYFKDNGYTFEGLKSNL